jgi:hypothetical protein
MIKLLNRLKWTTAFIVLVFCVNGCSFIIDLYVMNLSGKKISVEYKIHPKMYSQFTLQPELFPITGSEKMYKLGSKATGKLEVDTLTGIVKALLPDSMALRVGSVMNYYPEYDTNYTWQVEYLIIRELGSGDSLLIPGDSLGRFFEEMPGRIYAIPVRKKE